MQDKIYKIGVEHQQEKETKVVSSDCGEVYLKIMLKAVNFMGHFETTYECRMGANIQCLGYETKIL